MYIDFEDYRPEVPRIPSAISRSNGIFLAFNLHLLALLLIALFPDTFRSRESSEQLSQAVPVQSMREVPRFVYMEPPVERPAPPRPQAPLSDLDRRAASPVRPPVADDPDPFSRGNTRDRVVGAPDERRAGPDGPGNLSEMRPVQPAPPSVTSGSGAAVPLPAPPQPPPGGGRLGNSLRNLQQYLQDQNFNNPRGGEGPQDPLIQFDSKGVEFGPWIRRFIAQVKRNWYIPEAARLLRGRVSIKFVVSRDGRLTSLEIIRPSTVVQFDAAALNALRLSNPTLPLPTEYPDQTIDIILTFLYNEDRRP
jgi:TonB family protein